MNTYIYIYDGFVGFETVFAGMFMNTKGKVITVANDYSVVNCYEGFKNMPDKLLNNVNTDDVDVFIIPGGEPDRIINNNELHRIIRELNEKGKIIGAICAAPVHLAKAGILKSRKYTSSIKKEDNELFNDCIFIDEDVVIDDNIITAKGNAYIDFAVEIGRKMNIFADEEEIKDTYNYYKNIKSQIPCIK